MNARKTFLLFIFLFIIRSTFSQTKNDYNLWYFGNNAGIDFNSGIATPTSVNNFYIDDNSAVICDETGGLFMYTNGENLWNRNNQIMPNGAGLMGNRTGGQTALIVYLKRTRKFYLFTVPEYGEPEGLRYSIIDRDADFGKGDIISKNNLLYTPTTEKLAAIYNSTYDFFWIITHKLNSNNFACYKLDYINLDTIPVISSIGSSNQGGSYGFWHGAVGQLAISPDGKKIANALNHDNAIELFDFDINTGIVSNPILIPNINHSWGVQFSPDCNKLYNTEWTSDGVWQFDISNYTLSAIQASRNRIGTTTTPDPTYKAGYLQTGIDGKIYIAKVGSQYLSVIDTPNYTGALCHFTDNGFFLGGASTCIAGLTTIAVFPNSTIGINEMDNCYPLKIYPNPFINFATIEIPNFQYSTQKLELLFWDQKGQLVNVNYFRIDNKFIIRKENLATGQYIAEIKFGETIIGRNKFIIR